MNSPFDWYYRVPKEINEGLKKITINDFVGILTIQEKKYIGFSPISLFLDVTNDEAIKESKVELVELKLFCLYGKMRYY